MTDRINLELRRDLRETNSHLAKLNRELAAKMIVLAGQTGDLQPLLEAVRSLSAAGKLYSQGTTPISHAEIQKALGDSLLDIGRAEDNTIALEHAAIAYRGAITVASMLGATDIRKAAKTNYARVLNLLGQDPKRMSSFSAA